ncbi:MAG: D-2-hydroxyacid dehydrogenase [Deltaproteobacteria bacterium]|nr:D-2-hydroxyacid dehydrogenase [Deltaproteobacteria bacterium]
MRKLVVLDGNALNPGDISWDPMMALVDELIIYNNTPKGEILTRIGDAELILTNKTPILRDTIEKAPNLKYVGVLATGYNIVDVEAALEKNLVVTNIPSYATMAVAQFTIALLLEVAWQVGHHSSVYKGGRYKETIEFCFWDFPLMELDKKVLGIVGYGAIGKATANIARAMGMKVIAYNGDRPPKESEKDYPLVNFTELLAASDVISLHAPLNKDTQGMINKASISGMKDGVIIINTSRGGLIVEEDLACALLSGKVYYAAVDVLSKEPMEESNPLLKCPNCIITPHIAWAPKETRQRLMNIAAQNLAAYLKGEPQNRISSGKLSNIVL